MNLYRVIPQPPEVFDITQDSQRKTLGASYAPSGDSSMRAIMVTDSAGNTIDSSGTSTPLSRGADRALLGLLREGADVVIVGASTARAEAVPLPRSTPLVLLTNTGDLRGHKLVNRAAGGERLIVVTPPKREQILSDSLGNLPYELLIVENPPTPEELRQRISDQTGAHHMLVEGGRKTWEFFATITEELLIATIPPPRFVDEGIPPWWPGDHTSWTLQSLFTDDAQMLYYRHVIAPSGAP